MVYFAKSFFPRSKKEWFSYLGVSIPIVFGAVFYAFNSFVDNFMVTPIPNGIESLSYANSWTAIITSFYIGIATFGSVLVGQFFGTKSYDRLKRVINFRIQLCFLVAISFSIVAWIIPEPFLNVFSLNEDKNPAQTVLYLRWIAVSWCLTAFSFNTGNLLRETGYSKSSFLTTLIVLLTNIIFNSIFVYGLKFGVEGTAYASIIARIVALVANVLIVRIVNKEIFINYLKFYDIEFVIVKQFAKRLFGIVLFSVAITFVVLRTPLWYAGFPTVGNPDFAIKGATILGLSSTITNIMTAAFASINGSINVFISSHLGKGEYELAKKNANKIQGVNLIIALMFSIITFLVVLILIHIPNFAGGVKENALIIAKKKNFLNPEQFSVQAVNFYYQSLLLTTVVVCFYNPVWMWGVTSLRIIASGGRNNLISFVNVTTNLAQIGWLAFIIYFIVPRSDFLRNNLPITYAIFFISDIVKMGSWIWMQYKIDWAHNLNREYFRLKNKS